MSRATTVLEYISQFYIPIDSTISFITKDIGNNGFFVVYKNYYGKTRHAYIRKSAIIEYMLRYDGGYSNMTILDRNRKRKLIALKIISE